jgi:hypothetical protein
MAGCETTAMWQKNNAFCGLEHADDWELILHQVILLQSGELKTNIVCEDGIDSGISQIHVCRAIDCDYTYNQCCM